MRNARGAIYQILPNKTRRARNWGEQLFFRVNIFYDLYKPAQIRDFSRARIWTGSRRGLGYESAALAAANLATGILNELQDT